MLEMKKQDGLAQNAAVPFVFIKDTVTAVGKREINKAVFKLLTKNTLNKELFAGRDNGKVIGSWKYDILSDTMIKRIDELWI